MINRGSYNGSFINVTWNSKVLPFAKECHSQNNILFNVDPSIGFLVSATLNSNIDISMGNIPDRYPNDYFPDGLSCDAYTSPNEEFIDEKAILESVSSLHYIFAIICVPLPHVVASN